jgi:pSer/pThr/pTyr-binding forkhead associated (FHA) protein
VSGAGSSEATQPAGLQLEVLGGNAAGTAIGVDERLVFGRQSEGAGRLADDPELSRHHAEITRLPSGEYQLEDLSSTNGTYVNGTRLQEPAVLSLGDTVELGTTKLVVRSLPPAPTPASGAVDVRAATVVVDVPAAARTPKVEREPPAAQPEPTPAPPQPPAARPEPTPAPPQPPATPSQPSPAPLQPAPPPHELPPAPPEPTPPPPEPPPPLPQPPLELRLKVDLERSEAEIALDQGQSVRFRLQDGCWQIVDGDQL